MKYEDENWVPISASEAKYVLSFCYDKDGNPLYLPMEICKRLSVTGECEEDIINNKNGEVKDGYYMCSILTTDGMRWSLNPGGCTEELRTVPQSLGTNREWGTNPRWIYVDVDGCGNKNSFSGLADETNHKNGCMAYENRDTRYNRGTYKIYISSTGKVTPQDDKETGLLLNNPTED